MPPIPTDRRHKRHRPRGGPPWDAESFEVICCACGGHYDEKPKPDCTQASHHHFPTFPTSWGSPLKLGGP